ncbi:MAG: DNA replication protein [Alphaproteobacteria bacterium]|nr:DNA replication protein [Alphaproteobacteria bacterium]
MTKPEQLPFDLGHRHAYEREDFWVSGSNREAVAWLDKWPDWPAAALILFGPPASGKTHLLQVWKKEAGAREISPQDLLSLPAHEIAGAAKSVMMDDVLRVIGRRDDEEALFHLYNLLRERGGHLLLTAEKPATEWPFALPDLKSRLLAAPAVAVGSPDDELMAIVLTKLFSDRQIFVPQEVVQFILARIERSFLALRQVVDKIDHKALAEKRPVTIPLVREII